MLQPPPRRPAPDEDDSFDERYADERINQRSRPWVGYVALLLSGAYSVLGVTVLLVPSKRLPLPPAWRIGFGILLIIYGLLRLRRTFFRYFR